MRIIPGNTKVKIELFKGVSLADLLVGAVAAIMLALISVSSLPNKLVFVVIHLFITILLLARIDDEPNYLYIIHMIKHYGFERYFRRSESDQTLLDRGERGENYVNFEELFPKKDEKQADETTETEEELFPKSKAELKAEKKAAKKEYKEDQKKLKSGKLTKEEEDAIWQKRADESERKAKAKNEKKKDKIEWSDMTNVSAFTGIKDGYIEYGNEYYGAVLAIEQVEFRFFSVLRRTNSIEGGLGVVIRSINPDYSMDLVKLERPINYDNYIRREYAKLDELRNSYIAGFIKEDELKSRVAVVYDRIYELLDLRVNNRVVVPFYYLVLFDKDKKQLGFTINSAIERLRVGEINANKLNSKETALFLKYSNEIDFDESEIENINPEDYAQWAMPKKVVFTPRNVLINGMATHNMRVVKYPTTVNDGWLASISTYPSTKVVMKMKPMDSSKAISSIDRSISELRITVQNAKTDSEALQAREHLDTLQILLSSLQSDNESLVNCNIYVTSYDPQFTNEYPKYDDLTYSTLRTKMANMKRTVRRVWQEAGFKLNNMEYNQALAYIGSQISGYDPMEKDGRGIPTNTAAAAYPWVFPFIMDENGIMLGIAEGAPIFIDFFKRDSERVNSNMVIVGKSGSGKSYATKSILANLAAEDSKIFILDPEDEYRELAKNLNGKFINVANATYGRLNPFHIITSLEDDESEGEEQGSYATHLQFLEEFFKQILPDCDRDSLEYLNAMVDRVYKSKGIDSMTDLSTLKPEDYPIFDDLYEEILREFQRTDSEYIKSMLRTLMNYISKFSEGGRNAIIWNGPSSVTTEENFTVFNFQSLLSNRNTTVANAQMLLVLKYIDNEIIKNRDYNEKYNLNRKIVVVIDEAHVFIDAKYPVALDFMYQLAKRIRKYNGMQVVITQNIKDFVGSEELARKSAAIINACQYSFIFALSPNDMTDLCTLYEKAGGINESEQEQITQATRGQAFAIMSPTSRTTFKVTVPENVHTLFSKSNYVNPYFEGEGGDKNWSDYLKDANEKRELNNADANNVEADYDSTLDEEKSLNKRTVSFDEYSLEEYNEYEANKNSQQKVTLLEAEEADIKASKLKASDVILTEEDASSSSSKTEEMLAELTLKLGSDNMVHEIQKTVKEELDKMMSDTKYQQLTVVQVPAGTDVSQVATVASTPMVSTASVAPAVSESEESTESKGSVFDFSSLNLSDEDEEESGTSTNDSFDFGQFVGNVGSEEQSPSQEEEKEEGVALGNIFDFASLADLNDIDEDKLESDIKAPAYEDGAIEDDSSDSSDDFDVMAFLAQQADEIAENTPDPTIDDFINGSETVIDVTLEQLISYNKNVKNNEN